MNMHDLGLFSTISRFMCVILISMHRSDFPEGQLDLFLENPSKSESIKGSQICYQKP